MGQFNGNGENMALCANWDIPTSVLIQVWLTVGCKLHCLMIILLEASLLYVGSAAVQSGRMLHVYSCWIAEGGSLVQISCSFVCIGFWVVLCLYRLIVWSSIFV
jgi:hypothetical protein